MAAIPRTLWPDPVMSEAARYWAISIVYSICLIYLPTHTIPCTLTQVGEGIEEMEASSPQPQPLPPSVPPSRQLGSDTSAARHLPRHPAFGVAQAPALTVASSRGMSQSKKRKHPSTKASAYRPAATTTSVEPARPDVPTPIPQLHQDAAVAKSTTHKSPQKDRSGSITSSSGGADGIASGSSSRRSSSSSSNNNKRNNDKDVSSSSTTSLRPSTGSGKPKPSGSITTGKSAAAAAAPSLPPPPKKTKTKTRWVVRKHPDGSPYLLPTDSTCEYRGGVDWTIYSVYKIDCGCSLPQAMADGKMHRIQLKNTRGKVQVAGLVLW